MVQSRRQFEKYANPKANPYHHWLLHKTIFFLVIIIVGGNCGGIRVLCWTMCLYHKNIGIAGMVGTVALFVMINLLLSVLQPSLDEEDESEHEHQV